ncbi:hypothetical protein [Aureimonas sp. Leaf324]|jgi:DNA-binding MltR family transcriptional regulator|uniref:hypothetical protein n=1 Tax=Aureimonas sp. Leaf324 TaxID=1736336 RepID=UPI0006F281E3|nr:hypothetical protein [Aureimonas sp. Leaf324]KQQ85855.1 hypothetical protein ASF65_04785 [Aureimonas sp. Leaf324]
MRSEEEQAVLEQQAHAHMMRMQEAADRSFSYDDRGMVISYCAYIEETLEEVILRRLVDCKQARDLLQKPGGAISEFYARARMARALGCIDDQDLADLKIMASIRNKAAHSWQPFDFEERPISDMARNMSQARYLVPENNTRRLQFAKRATELLLTIGLLSFWTDRPLGNGTFMLQRIDQIAFEVRLVPRASTET